MTAAQLHRRLVQACEKGNVEEVKHYLDAGADVNFEIKSAINALSSAIHSDSDEIITLLLEEGAIVKEVVLQKAIGKDKNYLALLVPNFECCEDQTLLMGVLEAAINIADLELAQQAIHQGAKAESLLLSDIRELKCPQILALLLENGFNIHANANKIFSQWMGESPSGGWRTSRPPKLDILSFVSGYYLDKEDEISKLKASIQDTTRLFRLGLNSNDLNIMKLAVLTGVNKNEALNSVLHTHYADNDKEVDVRIIEYLLNSNITFTKTMISNAVCFKYSELLEALCDTHDLEYAYEMAYFYKKSDLCDYFIEKGVSKEAQILAQMKISAIQGNIKELRKAINEGANVALLDKDVLVQVINKNQVESLRCLYEAGVIFESSLNSNLDHAMNYHKAYETVSYLVEVGLDITHVKTMPLGYESQYPVFADMWKKRFTDIFNYTMYLAKEVYPKTEGKEKEEVLKSIAAFSALPYVVKKSEEIARGK